jgi:branched-subunit amino acid aminotransferase/4-amino-4-deoxychorismate lyase
MIWVDGGAADAAALVVPALVNYGHFTAMQVRHGAVRGLEHHLRRVDAAHRELFGHGLDLERVRARWALAVRGQPDAYLRPVSYTRPFAHLKHVGTFALIRYGNEAERAGFDDALLTTANGEIAETTIANIGFVAGCRVTWPTAPALRGIGQQLLEDALPPGAWRSSTCRYASRRSPASTAPSSSTQSASSPSHRSTAIGSPSPATPSPRSSRRTRSCPGSSLMPDPGG